MPFTIFLVSQCVKLNSKRKSFRKTIKKQNKTKTDSFSIDIYSNKSYDDKLHTVGFVLFLVYLLFIPHAYILVISRKIMKSKEGVKYAEITCRSL